LEEWGEWLRGALLLDVPHRQVVFTIPKMLRVFFKYKRKLLGDLCRCAVRAILLYFQAMAGTALEPGIVAVIQTFGDRINLHPHLHLLVTDGGVDEAGVFHRIPRIDDSRLAEVFSREVLAFLVGRELLSPEWAERILSWRHTGFSVHSRVRAKTKPEAIYQAIDRIIDHLKLRFIAEKPPPSRVFEQVALMAAEGTAEYF
jgi:hypothetical protein